jgi:hypothetical protein
MELLDLIQQKMSQRHPTKIEQMREKIIALFKADYKKMKAGREIRTEEGKAYREKLMAMFENDQGKTEARIEIGQERSNAEVETDLEEVEAMDFDPNPGKTEATVKRQEIPTEEPTVHSMTEWQKETVSCQETTEAFPEKKEPNPDDGEADVELREVPMKDAVVKPVRGWKSGRGTDI